MDKKKELAIKIMKELDIYKPYINDFEKNDNVCFFEGFGGFWVWQNEEALNKMRELEQKYDIKIYAITHEMTEFGELYDFLFVPSSKVTVNDPLAAIINCCNSRWACAPRLSPPGTSYR